MSTKNVDLELTIEGQSVDSFKKDNDNQTVNTSSAGVFSYSNKPTPEAVYFDGNFYYFLWDVSQTLDEPDGTSFLAYNAGKKYNPYGFGDTVSGAKRIGPRAVTTAPGILLGEDLLRVGDISPSYNNLDNWNPGETFDDRIALYEDVAPWFFDAVVDEDGNVDYPGMDLLFDLVINNTPIDPGDPRLLAIQAPYTTETIEYLNALGPQGYNIGGKPNMKLVALRETRTTQLDNAFSRLGLNPNDYKKDNPELYEQLLQRAVEGNVSVALLPKFVGYVENMDGYTVAKDSPLYSLFSAESAKLTADSSGLDLSDYIFNNKNTAKGIEVLGAGVFNSLSEADKKKGALLFATEGTESVEEYYQNIFDSNPYFSRFAGKGLNYTKVAAPYIKLYTSVFGEAPDEESDFFLGSFQNDYNTAAIDYRQNAYDTGNKFFGYNVASLMNKSLGGPVVRALG